MRFLSNNRDDVGERRRGYGGSKVKIVIDECANMDINTEGGMFFRSVLIWVRATCLMIKATFFYVWSKADALRKRKNSFRRSK